MSPKTMKGGNEATNGATPHGQKDKVLSPKKPVLALPTSCQEPTLSGGVTQFAEGEPICSNPISSSSFPGAYAPRLA